MSRRPVDLPGPAAGRPASGGFTFVEMMSALLLVAVLLTMMYNLFAYLRRVRDRALGLGEGLAEVHAVQLAFEKDFAEALSAPGWAMDRTLYVIEGPRAVFWSAVSRPLHVRGADVVDYSLGADGRLLRRVFVGHRHKHEKLEAMAGPELVQHYLGGIRSLCFRCVEDPDGRRDWTGKGLPPYVAVKIEFETGRLRDGRSWVFDFGFGH